MSLMLKPRITSRYNQYLSKTERCRTVTSYDRSVSNLQIASCIRGTEAPKLSDRIVPAPGDKDVDVGKGEDVEK